MVRWLRSWPVFEPPGRAHIVDDIPRLVIDNYDYTPLGDIDDDVCLLEWDMALSHEDRAAFEQSALMTPSYVLVAPYKLYLGSKAVWAHRRVLSMDRTRWVMTGESHCDLFSLGCSYLPRALIRGFLAAPAPERGRWPNVKPGNYTDCRFTDHTFSTWHYWRAGRVRTRIAWHVTPVHLHYPTPTEGTNHGQLSVSILSSASLASSGL